MEVVVVADSGPLLHLYWIGATSWALPECPIVVVESVLLEIEKYAPDILTEVVLTRVANPQVIPTELERWNLDDGERHSLAHVLSIMSDGPVLLLCDDVRARKAAVEFEIETTGTIGLLLQAAASERASRAQVRESLGELQGRGRLYVSDRLIQWALAEIEHQGAQDEGT